MTRLEAYGIALLILILAFVGAEFHGRHIGRQEQRDEFAAQALKQAEQSRAAEQAERDKLLQVSTSYEQQIAQIKVDAASRPARVVRLCNNPATTVPETAAATGESQSSPATQPAGTNGVDIGPGLRDYAADFKACAIQVNALLDAWPH